MSHSRCFKYNRLTARVVSDVPAHLTWLEEFLTPSFTLAESLETDTTAVLIVDDCQYDETFRRGPDTEGRQVDCFILDGGVVRLPLWASVCEDRVIFDERYKVFYFVNRDSSQIRVLTASQNLAARFALMRVVREFAMTSSRTSSSLVIHGAALAAEDGGIIIAGPKRAGKTSLLIHCLQDRGGQFVSNDRVVVHLDRSEPVLRGMPTVVTIRDQTMDLFPELQRPLLSGRYDYRFALSEGKPEVTRAVQPPRGHPFDLSPAQFCALLGVGMRGQSPVRALLFPQVSEGSVGIQVRKLSARTASKGLVEALIGDASSRRISQVFALASDNDCVEQAHLERLCLALTTQVPCFHCQLGRQAYQRGTASADFVNLVYHVRPAAHAIQGDRRFLSLHPGASESQGSHE